MGTPEQLDEQTRELKKANAHLKNISGWASFFGWLVLGSMILTVIGAIMGIIFHSSSH